MRGHRNIVNLIEATAAPMQNGIGYEVFILMEYCAGGGIIDMMNTRLQNRLTEAEILKIFSDVVEGVCWMHTRDPPLMHRDLKVENILLSGYQQYKLCDFGSTAKVSDKIPTTMEEIKALEVELNKHTTMQYRAPEMCDVWARKGVGLPADVWALGVLLYKLCFYTTPFEDQGPLAILNAQYTMPPHPPYSPRIRSLIASMLVEQAAKRPTAYEVHVEVCKQRNVSPNKEYVSPASLPSSGLLSLFGRQQPRARPPAHSTPSPAFDDRVATPNLPSRADATPISAANPIQPMRRGRPGKSLSVSNNTAENSSDRPNMARAPSNLGNTVVTPATSDKPVQMGFEDSFQPEQTVVESASAAEASTQTAPSKTKTALATAALFEELTNPGSSNKAPQTMAAMQAQLERDKAGVAAPSNVTWSSQRRVNPTSKPAGPRALMGHAIAASPAVASPSLQQPNYANTQSSAAPSALPSSASGPAPALSESQTQSMQRYPTVDDWDAGFVGQNGTTTPASSNGPADLLGDIAADDQLGITQDAAVASAPSDAVQTTTASPLALPNLHDEDTARISSPREKFKPIKRDSSSLSRHLSVLGETSSQAADNEGAAPSRQNSTVSNRSVRSMASVFSASSATSAQSASTSQGASMPNMSLVADSSITNGRPPVQQETVRSPLLSSGAALTDVAKKPPPATKPKLPTKPPKPSAKPSNLSTPAAKSEISAMTSPPLPSSKSLEDFNTKFPAIQPPVEASIMSSPQQANRPFPSALPPSSSPRVPFKPSRENSSNSISSLAGVGAQSNGMPRTRPVSMMETSPVQSKIAVLPSTAAVREDEEEFQGVANLRSRFQQMGPSAGDASAVDTRPRRTSSLSQRGGYSR